MFRNEQGGREGVRQRKNWNSRSGRNGSYSTSGNSSSREITSDGCCGWFPVVAKVVDEVDREGNKYAIQTRRLM